MCPRHPPGHPTGRRLPYTGDIVPPEASDSFFAGHNRVFVDGQGKEAPAAYASDFAAASSAMMHPTGVTMGREFMAAPVQLSDIYTGVQLAFSV